VHTFTGRIRDIEPAGGVLACATDGGLLFYDPAANVFAPPIADAGCTNGECLTSNQLTCVSRDASGAYWLGTEASGAIVFRPSSSGRHYGNFFSRSTAPGGGLLADSVRCIEAWGSETVYVGTSRGVGQIDLAGGVDSYNPDAARILGATSAAPSCTTWPSIPSSSGWRPIPVVSRYNRTPPYAVEILRTGLEGPEPSRSKFSPAPSTPAPRPVSSRGRKRRTPGSGWRKPASRRFRALSLARLANGRLFAGSEANMWTWNGFAWSTLNPDPVFLIENRAFIATAATGDSVWTCQQNTSGEGAFPRDVDAGSRVAALRCQQHPARRDLDREPVAARHAVDRHAPVGRRGARQQRYLVQLQRQRSHRARQHERW
jgi:hypothetical protein